MERKSILYVSLSMETAQSHRPILREIFSNDVDVYLYALQDRNSVLANVRFDVVLAAGVNSYAKCLEMFPRETVLCCARELAFPTFLDPVLRLPQGKKVLVVCETMEVAREVTLQLLHCGINHLDYVPYWPGSDQDVGAVDTAMSPGMTQHVPAHIKTIIDMQRRPIAMKTILDIIKILGVDNSYIDRYTAMNRRFVFETYRMLSEKEDQNIVLARCIEALVQAAGEAVIVTEDETVLHCSPAAAGLLGESRNRLLRRRLPAVVSTAPGARRDGEPTRGVLRRGSAQMPFSRLDLPRRHGEKGCLRVYFLNPGDARQPARESAPGRDEGHAAGFTFSEIIAESPTAREAKARAVAMAASPIDATVLILGESGSGKEMFAQSIHNASSRAAGPFVAVNFGAIPESLVESELFGYEQGAFTGASRSGKKGLFELAAGGTLFLDEITNASTLIQVKLLRVLEARRLMRVGGIKMIDVNARVITATNADIRDLAARGLFREDLYHRLNAFTLYLPPLRERPECLGALLAAFMRKRGLANPLSPAVREALHAYPWPGNIRELKNAVDYLTLKKDKGAVTLSDLPHFLRAASGAPLPGPSDAAAAAASAPAARAPDGRAHAEGGGTLPAPCVVGAAILRLFREHAARGETPGRKKMLAALAARGIRISAGRYLAFTARLAEQGLLSIGRTKQGCSLTEAGLRVLDR